MKKKRKYKKLSLEFTIDHWFYHVQHLERNISYLKECKVCNIKELHAGKQVIRTSSPTTKRLP
jgi:hypothetical protein